MTNTKNIFAPVAAHLGWTWTNFPNGKAARPIYEIGINVLVSEPIYKDGKVVPAVEKRYRFSGIIRKWKMIKFTAVVN